MTSIRLPYVLEYVDRHGKVRRYFRRRGSKQIALPGIPGSDEFMAAYQAALSPGEKLAVFLRTAITAELDRRAKRKPRR